jgi:hypothetical protein
MPAYNAQPSLSAIAPGDAFQVWNAEQPVPGAGGASASQQVAAYYAQGIGTGISFKGFFSAAPGAFEIDVQASDVDADAQYQTLPNGNITTVDAINNTFLYEDVNANHKFYRALMRIRTNAVNVTANFKR